uniref:Zinc finger and BTB domain containing 32 n=1 Tax=Anabas testudineus TaxID=64144 RepID=A0A3Q1I012_ANATE
MSFRFASTFNLQSPSGLNRVHADTLRRSGSLCDAIISVKSQTFRAHRLVLACASRRLAQQLAQGDSDSPVHCTLEYFSPHTFQQVLDFTYTQALEVSVDDLHLLLRAAQLLEMQPLEDQCQKQLDTLNHRATAGDKRSEVTDVKEEIESAEKADEKNKGSQLQDEKVQVLQETFSSVEETSDDVVVENLLPPDPAKNHNSSHLQRKKPRLSHVQAAPYSRDSVITKPHFAVLLVYFSYAFPFLHRNKLYWYSILITALKLETLSLQDVRSSEPQCPPQSSQFLTFSHPVAHVGEACAGCRFCGREDGVQHEPQSHRQDHRGEKPYQCQHCPKKFSLKHQLDTHHRVHTGEKPFECRLCGQRSRDYSAMIKHLRTHGGAAPYQCTVCLEFCSSLVAMQRHIKSHAVQDFPADWSINSTYLYTSHI